MIKSMTSRWVAPASGGCEKNFKKHCYPSLSETVESDETLALTLALSPEEREHRSDLSGFSDDSAKDSATDISGKRNTILPLLGGEGRGEGERSSIFNHNFQRTRRRQVLPDA